MQGVKGALNINIYIKLKYVTMILDPSEGSLKKILSKNIK